MFRITGNLANFRKFIHHYHHQIRVPIANVSYPPRDYTPQEREPCPPPPQEPPPKPRDDSVFWGAMAVVVITAGFAVYAKNSPEVRDWLVIQAPWFDDLIAVMYQENMSYGQFAWKCVEDVKNYINNIVNDDKPKTCSMDENTAKITLSDNSMAAIECDGTDGTCPSADPVPVMTKNICEVVECVRDRADTALSNYEAAISACTLYNKNVEEAMKNFSITSGKDLPNQMAERKKIVNKSVAHAEEATLDLDELIRFIECGVQASKEDIDNVMQMINDYQQKIKVSSIKFQLENEKSSMLDQLWMKVECGIQKYTQETETMFPEVRYAQNKLQMTGDLDLLLHHTFRYVQRLKEELDEVVAGITDKVDRGLDTLPQGEKKKQRDALIESTIKQRRAEMNKEYQDRYDELVKKNEAILSESLKDQLERHQESLETKLQQKDDEANAKLNKMVTEKVAFEKNVIKHQLEDMAFKLKLVEDKLNRSLKAEHDAKRSQELWNAGSALLAATKKGENYVKVDKELRAIEKASGEGDELVTSVLKAIPDSVREKGVVPESVLKKRYHKMERTALRVALVEQDGGPLPVYFLSWLQSVLLFMKISGIPQEEADKPGSEPINPDLDTFDLLQRARYWMNRGNIAAAIRYVGALEGASLEAAKPWHEAAKAHLETKQAAEAVLAHAASLGLQYMWGMLFILTLIVFGLWAWSRRKNSSNEPPLHPGALPLIGHAHRLIGDSAELWKRLIELADTCSGVGGVIAGEIGPRTVYVLTDPEDCMTVSNACLEKDGFYEFAKPWLGEGLVTGTLSIWKVHRKLLNPAFSQVVLDGFLELLNRQARRLVKDLSVEVGKGPFDHWVYTRHNAIETICLTALGVDYSDKTILTAEYVQATEQILNVFVERFQKFWWHNNFLYEFSNLKKKQDELLKILHHMSNTVLKKRKAEYLKNRNTGTEMEKPTITGVKFKPFMDLLLELSIEKGAFNDQEIREHVDTMIIGGHDTSASVLMFSLLLIGSYPHVQERIFEELREVFGNDDRDATKQDLSRLVYTEAVLKESMRIYPIVPVIARTLDKDVKLRNCTLTSGRTCFMLVCGIHRHSTWGPDAEVFRPERWLDLATLPEHPGAFAAFSMGRRICIGKSYAYMSMKTVLAHVLRHYKVKGDHKKMDLKIDVMLKPVSGYYISIEKRTDRN